MFFSRSIVASAIMSLVAGQSASSFGSSGALLTATSSAAGSASTGGLSAVAGMVNTHIVQVGGPNGSLAFYPNNVKAAPGDLVQFQFHAKNHSVVQSTFDQPCVPIQNIIANKTDAFFSGFMPTNASFTATSQVMTYTIRVKDEKPVWFYCSQGKHCQAGMVGAINAAVSGNKTMQAFTALAAQAPENLSPGSAGGASGNTPPSPSAGGGAAGGDGTNGGAAGGAGGASGTGANPAQATANTASGFSTQSFFSLGVAAFAVVFML